MQIISEKLQWSDYGRCDRPGRQCTMPFAKKPVTQFQLACQYQLHQLPAIDGLRFQHQLARLG
jgi:hypothetical protein